MPFNSAGVYSLPEAAFVTNTTISSSAVNSNFSDIASALTTSYQAALAISAQAAGNCRLTKSAASTLLLSPYNGDALLIQGTIRTIPSAGASLTLSGLTANTLYYVYAFWSGTAVTLEASTTGHTTDTTYGNEIKTGDATRSLVGMFYATTTTDTEDTASQRYVASWFNPTCRLLTGSTLAAVNTSSTTFIELGVSTTATNGRIEFVKFASQPGEVFFQGVVSNATVSVYTLTNVAVDNTVNAFSDLNLFNNDNPAVIGPFNVGVPVVSTSVFTEGRHYVIPLGSVNSTGPGSWTGTIRGWVT